MPTPYDSQPPQSFWRAAVAEPGPFGLTDLWTAKFPIAPDDRISSAGSCFAQHLGRRLRRSGFAYQDFEPPPALLPEDLHPRFGYGVYSGRYGNIYTARQLLQLALRALGEFVPQEDHWKTGGRFYDPFRPAIEPDGFDSLQELRATQQGHLDAVRLLLESTDVFVFTLGLTEAWMSAEDGAVYPVCPGTVAGTFDAAKHVFHNFTYEETLADLRSFIGRVRAFNPGLRVLLTVSPVPLTATASSKHVLSATTYSKSVLRAVTGRLEQTDPGVDYFPSFELISAFPQRAMFYEPNMRSVAAEGVDYVMKFFFEQHRPPLETFGDPSATDDAGLDPEELVCEEEYID
jgi:hypothetical protein